LAARLVEGWTITGITTFSSGSPVTIRTVDDVSNTGASQQRPDVLFDPELARGARTASRWFKTEAFVNPPVPRFGNAGRGLITNPGVSNFDLSVLKNTRIQESLQLQFRAEFFNAWNHTQLGTPSFQLGDSDFGSIGSARSPRIIQLALKLVF
jgi:hypothetical protein